MRGIVIIFILLVNMAYAQEKGINEDFKNEIDKYLEFTVPVMMVEELAQLEGEVLILDAREKNEYKVSKIPGAVHIGYDYFDRSELIDLDKNKKVVVYCSIGYRSEKIAEKLMEEGFQEVYNLYGSIFAWANAGYSIVRPDDTSTNKLHTYNKKWSQWVSHPDIEKVW